MSEANKQTIRRIREEAAANPDLLDGLFTDDYVYHDPSGSRGTPRRCRIQKC